MATSVEFSKVEAAAPSAPFQYARLPMPPSPARSMPQPFDRNGKLVNLPPLPEAVASADLDRIKPAPNQPSPQAPVFASPSAPPGLDTELARTSFDAETPVLKRPPSFQGSDTQTRIALAGAGVEALEKASLDLDLETVEVDYKEIPPVKGGCAKCDADEMECPLAGASAIAPGGLKLASETATQIDITVKKPGASPAPTATADLSEALKAPGRIETAVIPLGGKLSLEIKARVVPAATEKAVGEEMKAVSPPSTR